MFISQCSLFFLLSLPLSTVTVCAIISPLAYIDLDNQLVEVQWKQPTKNRGPKKTKRILLLVQFVCILSKTGPLKTGLTSSIVNTLQNGVTLTSLQTGVCDLTISRGQHVYHRKSCHHIVERALPHLHRNREAARSNGNLWVPLSSIVHATLRIQELPQRALEIAQWPMHRLQGKLETPAVWGSTLRQVPVPSVSAMCLSHV